MKQAARDCRALSSGLHRPRGQRAWQSRLSKPTLHDSEQRTQSRTLRQRTHYVTQDQTALAPADSKAAAASTDAKTLGSPETEPEGTDGWIMLVVLSAVVTLICSVDRAAMSVSILPMSIEFNWDDSVKGSVSSAFFAGCVLPSSEPTAAHTLGPTACPCQGLHAVDVYLFPCLQRSQQPCVQCAVRLTALCTTRGSKRSMSLLTRTDGHQDALACRARADARSHLLRCYADTPSPT